MNRGRFIGLVVLLLGSLGSAASAQLTSANLATDLLPVLRPSGIAYGFNQIGWGRCAVPGNLLALNMTGTSSHTSNVWLAVEDGAHSGSMVLAVDIGIWRNNEIKGAGVAWGWNGSTGLAVFALDSKSDDRFELAKIENDRSEALESLHIGDALPIHATRADILRTGIHHIDPIWFRVEADITADDTSFSVVARIFSHTDPTDPSTDLAAQVGPTLTFGPATFADVGVSSSGQIGVAGHAEFTSVNTSIASFLTSTGPADPIPVQTPSPIGGEGSDLVVTDARVLVNRTGSPLLHFTIKNVGVAPAPAGSTTTVSLPVKRLYSYLMSRPLAPGASRSVSKRLPPAVVPQGDYLVTTTVDSTSVINETDETNNSLTVGPVTFGRQCVGVIDQ